MAANMKEQLYVSTAAQLLEEGLFSIGEQGDAFLTPRGKERVRRKMDKLSSGEQIMLQLAFAEGHGIAFSLF